MAKDVSINWSVPCQNIEKELQRIMEETRQEFLRELAERTAAKIYPLYGMYK